MTSGQLITNVAGVPPESAQSQAGPATRRGADYHYGHWRLYYSPCTGDDQSDSCRNFVLYEYLIAPGHWQSENPMQQRPDPVLARVSERHRPFMGAASRQRPVRRVVRVKTIQRLPRPLEEDQVAALLGTLGRWRDRAMVLLMLHGGLRPGEVLCLHPDDVQYGRQRVIVRDHTDHPKGARTKSRTEP
jgi:integrase